MNMVKLHDNIVTDAGTQLLDLTTPNKEAVNTDHRNVITNSNYSRRVARIYYFKEET